MNALLFEVSGNILFQEIRRVLIEGSIRTYLEGAYITR